MALAIKISLLITIHLFGVVRFVTAQDNTISTTAYRQAFIYSEAGISHQQLGILNPGIPVTIIERNAIGNWVRVQNQTLDGWVITGYLNLPPELLFSNIPINTIVRDANPDNINSRSMSELATSPILPSISDRMVEIHAIGQELGQQANVITKIGDSLTVSDQYMRPFSYDDYILGPYDYLEDTLLFYGASTAEISVASRGGLSTYVIFDPFWANKDLCQPNESPIACEYRLKNPSVAFIMFGPNDVRSMTKDIYANNMRDIIEITLESGIIPVISTISADPGEDFFWQTIEFNLELLTLADEYEIPLINFWLASQILPDYGLDVDKVHLHHSGFDFLKYDTGHEAFYGISLHNLLTLRTLHAIYEALYNDEP